MIVVDTSVWVDYFNGIASAQAERLDRLLSMEPIIVGDLVLTEILQGFSNDHAAVVVLGKLRAFPFASMVGWTIAVKSAENYRLLRSKGITVRKTVDLWIGTFCIEHGCKLLHNDRDFQPMVDHLGLALA
jgi:predicted nucleic acid-binding protein